MNPEQIQQEAESLALKALKLKGHRIVARELFLPLITERERLLKVIQDNRPDGSWMDKCGACRVCDGEIPHGHTANCDLYKLEQLNERLRKQLEEARK